jgi:hypothetical protein
VTSDRDRFESAVDAEGTKHVTNVVVDRLRAEVELLSDLFGRASVFEQTKHLDLTWGEMRVRRCGFLCGASLNEPKDADHAFTANERHSADLHGHARAVAPGAFDADERDTLVCLRPSSHPRQP